MKKEEKKKIHGLYQNRNGDMGEENLISVKMAITEQIDTSEYATKHEYRTLICMSAIY